jgi:diguanylate cyclase (GGDEF)-like protein
MREFKPRIDELNKKAWDRMLSSPEEALSLAEKAFAEAEEATYAMGMSEARLSIAWCESYLSRPTQAIDSFQKALDGFSALGDSTGQMKALNGLGSIYADMARYERAMDYYAQSLEEARKNGNRFREAVTLNNIGEVCLDLGELKEALDYFLKAYETVQDDSDPELVSNMLFNIGNSFYRMENWPLAREFTEKAMAIASSAGIRLIECRCWHSLGLISQVSERFSLAESQYSKALAIAEELKNERERILILLDLGSIHSRRGDLDPAQESFETALAGAEGIGSKALIHSAYERLSEAHEARGDYKTALEYYRRFSRYEHEVLSEDTSRKIKNITVQYEVEKSRQEAEIYRLKNIELKEKTEALEEANQQILAISDTGRKITASLDFDTIAVTIQESLSGLLDAACFGIALYDKTEDAIDWRYLMEAGIKYHRPEMHLDPSRSYASWCVANRTRIVINDADAEYRNYLAGERITVGTSSQSLVFLPLMIEQRVIGVITIQSYTKRAYSDQQVKLLEALAPYVAIAIENSLIHDRLETLNRAVTGEKERLEKAAVTITHMANHDSLTGLPNRRLLFELLQKTFDLSARDGSKVGVLYIDLDDFKPINDRFGHFAGDRALVAIAERLRSQLRAMDTVARVGGDEFVVVLAKAQGLDEIDLVARRILEECRSPLEIQGVECRVGLSMGIAVYPDDGLTIERLLNVADSAMYGIKRGKKDGYAFATRKEDR